MGDMMARANPTPALIVLGEFVLVRCVVLQHVIPFGPDAPSYSSVSTIMERCIFMFPFLA